MEVKEATIPGLLLIQPNVFCDSRGYFFESYNKNKFNKIGLDVAFVQDNQSFSSKGTLRGLHFQNPPFAQGKLLSVARGAVLDVAVDIRKDSGFYGKHFSIILSEENKTMFWVPPGFAHGFLALEGNTLFMYKCTHEYNKESEVAIRWNDPDLKINWNVTNPVISEKDANAPLFRDLASMF